MAIERRLTTVEMFEQVADTAENAERLLELIHGEIVEKVPTEEHGVATGNLHGFLWNYSRQTGIGRLVIEGRYRNPEDQHNARIPDLAFTVNPAAPPVQRGSVPRMPDLAIEVRSPDQPVKTMREKARYYLANGVNMVWLVFTDQRIVEVYTLDSEAILTETDTLIR